MFPCFVADRMLGRLARMLRLLGYDTVYSSKLSPVQITELAQRENRVVLTRGDISRRFVGIEQVMSLKSENPPEQLREVVARLRLDTRTGLWTRCTLCNNAIVPIEKAAVEALVKPKVLQIYSEFFRCAGCGHIYWRGSHVERILKNLTAVLGQSEK